MIAMDGTRIRRLPQALAAGMSCVTMLTSACAIEMFILDAEFDWLSMRCGSIRILPIPLAVAVPASLMTPLRWYWAVPLAASVGIGLAAAYIARPRTNVTEAFALGRAGPDMAARIRIVRVARRKRAVVPL